MLLCSRGRLLLLLHGFLSWLVSLTLNARSILHHPSVTAASAPNRQNDGEREIWGSIASQQPSSERRKGWWLVVGVQNRNSQYVHSINRSSAHTYFAHVHPIFQSKWWWVAVPKQSVTECTRRQQVGAEYLWYVSGGIGRKYVTSNGTTVLWTYSNEFREKCLPVDRRWVREEPAWHWPPTAVISSKTSPSGASRSMNHWFEFEVLCPYLLGIFRAKWSTLRISLDSAVCNWVSHGTRVDIGKTRGSGMYDRRKLPFPLQNGTSLINPN